MNTLCGKLLVLTLVRSHVTHGEELLSRTASFIALTLGMLSTDIQSQHAFFQGEKYPVYVLAGCISAIGLSGPLIAFHSLAWWWTAAELACAVAALAALALTHYVDPGVLPRCTDADPLIELLEAEAAQRDDHAQRAPVVINDKEYLRARNGVWRRASPGGRTFERYCITCNIWRPPRAHHCNVCGLCMRHFDHHCGMVGTCIAELNHRWFTLFLCSAFVSCCFLSVGTGLALGRMGFPGVMDWPVWPLLVVEAVYIYGACISTFGVLHLTLMLCDLTSKEVVLASDVCADKPCCPGSRSLPQLLSMWRRLFCGPVHCRYDVVQADRLLSVYDTV